MVVGQYDPMSGGHMDISPIYRTFTSSISICLLLLALALIGILLNTVLRKYRYSSPATGLSSRPARAMSVSQDDFRLPPPTPDSLKFDPLLPDPLAGVYFPITSGQLAALSGKVEATSEPEPVQESDSTTEVTSAVEAQSSGSQLAACIQYFDDRTQGETWQRRVVVYDKGGQNVT